MGFNPGGGISTANDVALNSPSNRAAFVYNTTIEKWTNAPYGLPASQPTNGQVLTATSATQTSWVTPSSGSGNILTPEQFGAVGDGVADDTAALASAVAAAQSTKAPIQLTKRYRGRIDASNQHLILIGEGSLVQYGDGEACIAATHAMGTPISVTGIDYESFIGPLTSKDSPPATVTVTAATVAAGSLPQFKAEDTWRIDSRDVYPWAGDGSPVNGNVWQAAMFPILGIGYQITPLNGGIKENDTVVGATSGASALVGSYARDADSLTGKIILKYFNGGTAFQVGETILVGGSARGTIDAAGQLLMKGRLEDTYTTSPVLRKLRDDLTFIIDGPTVEASTNTDGLVGNSNRVSSVILSGVVNARIRANIKDAWKGALLLNSCYQADVDVQVGHLPNNATTGGSSSNQPSEQAYGYGVEIVGATERSFFKIHASNCRHAFTTNPATYGSWSSISSDYSLLRIGIQKDNVVTGVATGCWSAGWDTHEGAQRTHFRNCENIATVGGYRFQSVANGFQNRAWNTQYTNCRDYGSLNGFRDGTGSYPTDTMSVTRYTNCLADNFQYLGFSVTNPSESANHRVVYNSCVARGNGQTANQPYGSAGFEINGVDAEIINCTAERFTQAPLQIVSAPSAVSVNYLIRDFTMSYAESPTNSASGIRISGTNHVLVVDGLNIIQKAGVSAMPAGAVRVMSGSPTIRWGQAPQTLNSATVVPWLVNAGTPSHEKIAGSSSHVHIGTTAPDVIFTDRLWLDTSGGAGVLKRYNGTAWV